MSNEGSFFTLFVDPVFRGPMLGSLLMSISTALVGAIAFVRKKSLVGETLSHATFPGVALGMLVAGILFPERETLSLVGILMGALFSALIGQLCMEKMLKHHQKADVTLCYILSSFLGAGVLLTSFIQQEHVMWYRKIQVFFYGQAATMMDVHIYLYGILSFFVGLVIFLLYRAIQATCFDPIFAESVGIKKGWVSHCCSLLLCLAIVIGIRSVGVVLMTGMLIAPAVAAKCLTQQFSRFLVLSAVIGIVSAFVGNYLATITPLEGTRIYYLPTGPATVLVASLIAFLALLFSPTKGVLVKAVRRRRFQESCILENLLKAFWKREGAEMHLKAILGWKVADRWLLYTTLRKLVREGWIHRTGKGGYMLTEDGRKKAAYIVRLHRLWELYLVEHLGDTLGNIHRSAEEMEHLITPDIEVKLTKLLLNPTQDPHKQPIPIKELL